MKLKLFKKYFFTTAVIILFSLTVMMMILLFVFNNYLAKSKYNTLSKCCNSVEDFISKNYADGGNGNFQNLFGIMNTVSDVSEVDMLIADTYGKLLVCNCETWQETNNCDHVGAVVDSELLSRVKSNDVFELSTLGIYDKVRYVSAQSINDSNNNLIGYVFATAPVSSIRLLMSTLVKLYLISAAFPLIVMFFAIYAMTYRLTKPLKLMSEASKAMAKGDFSKRIPVTSDDEIGELAVSFNQMTNSLVQLEGMRRSFVANVSHELKTPMTTISGFIDGIIDGTIEPDKQQYYLNIVSEEVKRLSRLVQSMLSMAKLESGEFVIKPELFDFRELLRTIVVSQEQRIEKKSINIEGLDSMADISVNADRDLIHQVVYNLVDNAIKFTEEQGTISFSLKTESKKMVFEITNTGEGIPEAELPYVFERFYKVDKSRSVNKNSTGLGLYIARTIIKAHGGVLSVASSENKFTTFRVVLPL